VKGSGCVMLGQLIPEFALEGHGTKSLFRLAGPKADMSNTSAELMNIFVAGCICLLCIRNSVHHRKEVILASV
jgi:hypothetical protein